MSDETWSTFFDAGAEGETPKPRKAAGGQKAKRSNDKADGGAMSVAALLARVKDALADALPKRVTVVGEISNFKAHSSGHMYFSLKDAE